MDNASHSDPPVDVTQQAGAAASRSVESETPACQSCRQRKLKCSREDPMCSQCARLGSSCSYDRKKQKPGIKAGAVEQLNQRLGFLENLLLDGDGNLKAQSASDQNSGCVYHAALLLTRELQPKPGQTRESVHSGAILSSDRSILNCGEESPTSTITNGALSNDFPRKRKRKDSLMEYSWDNFDRNDILSSLPSTPVLTVVVEAFFDKVRPWIPFLHPRRFRAALQCLHLHPELGTILHAISCTTMKYLKGEIFGLTQSEMDRQVRFSHDVVMLTAMDNLTIEGIQALIIIAFDSIGSGHVSKAWPIIGSLTRTVEYLQLTVEPCTVQQYSISTPISLLSDASDWVEAEARRRVFWNVFLLDRFCSITTGWNTSLTSDDVHRRLPCDWGLWSREEEVVTPYFGIWNKAAARIGNSVAYIPAHYPSEDCEADRYGPDGIANSGPVDTSKLGAFAYRIEATESLSQITSYFLQQRVDLQSTKKITNWLTRFKELDLRLVHWKMFLPQKWKDSNISRDSALINMDPNLTLAHITHNTSMILLHQHIAYPPPELTKMIELPSSCSAETCRLAAVETAVISQKFLKHTNVEAVNSEFALCAFVAARILIVRWRLSGMELLPEFFHLVECLEQISILWQGEIRTHGEPVKAPDLDLAAMYAQHLRSLHEKCVSSQHFRVDPNYGGLLPPLAVPNWSRTWQFVSLPSQYNVLDSEYPHDTNFQTTSQPLHNRNFNLHQAKHISQTVTPEPSIQADTVAGPSTQPPSSTYHSALPRNFLPSNPSFYISSTQVSANMDEGLDMVHPIENKDELTEMSNSLLDQQFLEMDRVISLQDADFTLGVNMWDHGV